MRRPLTLTILLLAAAMPAAVVLLMLRAQPDSGPSAAAGESPATAGQSVGAGASQTAEAGGVEVTATLEQLDDDGAVITLAFDTHTVALDLDLPAAAGLTVDGAPWTAVDWDGDGPGGHHRAGSLLFEATGPAVGDVELSVAGLPAPVTLTWTNEETP